jgi:hypothetical protein
VLTVQFFVTAAPTVRFDVAVAAEARGARATTTAVIAAIAARVRTDRMFLVLALSSCH